MVVYYFKTHWNLSISRKFRHEIIYRKIHLPLSKFIDISQVCTVNTNENTLLFISDSSQDAGNRKVICSLRLSFVPRLSDCGILKMVSTFEKEWDVRPCKRNRQACLFYLSGLSLGLSDCPFASHLALQGVLSPDQLITSPKWQSFRAHGTYECGLVSFDFSH